MADLRKSVLGDVSGVLGDLVFRQTKTANVIATRPASFMPGTDQASVDRRYRFGFTTKLASAVNKIPELYQLWEIKDADDPPFRNLVKTNYPYVDPAGVPGNFKLTPEEGFGTTATLLTVSPVEIHAELDPLGTNKGIDLAKEVGVKLASLLCLTNPVDEFAPAYNFIRSVSDELPLQLVSSLLFTVPLMDQETALYNAYTDCDAYFVIVTVDADGNVIHYSNTFRNV